MGLQRRACAIISEADVIWTLLIRSPQLSGLCMSVGFSHIGSRKQSYAKCFSSLAPSIKSPSAHQRKRWVGGCGTCTKSCDSCVAWLGGVAPVQSLVTLVLLGWGVWHLYKVL